MNTRSYVLLRGRLLGDASIGALAETFKLLGDTTRVRLLDALSRSELCVHDLAQLLGLTQSATSHQLRLLRNLRVVRTRRDGRQVFYALDDDHIVALFRQGLEHVEERAASNAATSAAGGASRPADEHGAKSADGHPARRAVPRARRRERAAADSRRA